MSWQQYTFELGPMRRGFHLITSQVIEALPQISQYDVGLLHLFLQHSSASLTINENADPTVRSDLEQHFNRFVPEDAPYYQHDYEGSDDMPAHIKSSTIGCQLTVPITNGQLALGTWQGIYLCEHRNHSGARRIVATIQGQ
ncbi:secondary thiamine-phosphate synthase enzyme YjbQ [Thalassotalea ponticola]|uniref:secondary thiamine-phosphate synthase enzyme YjbQ n=1 Tax=Thalassotalea ponticola TaxID=1523392 RepID=UPI0025B4C43A|nr:secondary thiamine-phosphate synthase enzyme YjbQ [Thalassotalea ponticola]MDN3652127.1 secondary thiamine-phosphate synthase enzyme YjbQ [Thalassotalea ponticola]